MVTKFELKHVFAGGFFYGIVDLVSGFIITQPLVYLISLLINFNFNALWNSPAFLPMNQMWGFYLLPFIRGLVFSAAFSMFYKCIKEKGLMKGFYFGFIMWLVGTLPGMYATASTFAISPLLVLIWTLDSYIRQVLGCGAIEYVFEKLK